MEYYNHLLEYCNDAIIYWNIATTYLNTAISNCKEGKQRCYKRALTRWISHAGGPPLQSDHVQLLTLCDCDLDYMMNTKGRVKVFGPKSKIVGEWAAQSLEIFIGCWWEGVSAIIWPYFHSVTVAILITWIFCSKSLIVRSIKCIIL